MKLALAFVRVSVTRCGVCLRGGRQFVRALELCESEKWVAEDNFSTKVLRPLGPRKVFTRCYAISCGEWRVRVLWAVALYDARCACSYHRYRTQCSSWCSRSADVRLCGCVFVDGCVTQSLCIVPDRPCASHLEISRSPSFSTWSTSEALFGKQLSSGSVPIEPEDTVAGRMEQRAASGDATCAGPPLTAHLLAVALAYQKVRPSQRGP